MKTRAIRNAVIGLAAVATLTLVTAAPASATVYYRSCGGSKTFTLSVNARMAQVGDNFGGGDCGTVAVRAHYNLPNGVTAYTSWMSGSTGASVTIPSTATMLSADFRGGTYYYYSLTP